MLGVDDVYDSRAIGCVWVWRMKLKMGIGGSTASPMLGMAMTPLRPQGRGSADGHRLGFARWYMLVDKDGGWFGII